MTHPHAVLSHRLQIRRWDFPTEGSDIRISHIISDNHDNIRTFVLRTVRRTGEDNAKCGKCYFFFHGLFSISDYGCCTRAAGKCGKRNHQPENLPITSARQAFSPFRSRGQARSGARISVKKSNSRYKVGCSRHC